jgi:predicted PurR-regulated permease PerM
VRTLDARPEPPSPPGSVRATLVTYLLLMGLVLVPLLFLLSPYLVSLATGAILAALCWPLHTRLSRRLPAWLSALVVTLGVVLLVLAPIVGLGIGAVRQAVGVIAQLTGESAPTLEGIVVAVRDWVPFVDRFGSPEELQALLKSGIASVSGALSRAALHQIQAFPVVLLQLALVTLSTYFALLDGRALYRWIGDKLPLSLQIQNMLAASFQSATRAVVLASVAAAGTQAIVIWIGFTALRVPFALLGAGLTFMLGWVPGAPTLVWAAAAVYLYTEGSIARAAIMVGIGLVVGIVDNIVRPLVLSGQEAIHPMVSLVAVLGGIAFFGVPGVFIGPLVACMAIAVLEIWPAVASYCGIAVSGSGDSVPNVPMLEAQAPEPVQEALAEAVPPPVLPTQQ